MDKSSGEILLETKDHKPTDEDEEKRIEKAGSMVFGKRLDGVMAVSRNIGGMMKWVYDNQRKGEEPTDLWGIHSPKGKRYHPVDAPMSSEPDIYHLNANLKDGEVTIVLACDGFFDVFENKQVWNLLEEAGDIVKKEIEKGEEGKSTSVAAIFVKQALEKGSTDNVSVMVLH